MANMDVMLFSWFFFPPRTEFSFTLIHNCADAWNLTFETQSRHSHEGFSMLFPDLGPEGTAEGAVWNMPHSCARTTVATSAAAAGRAVLLTPTHRFTGR